MWVPDLELTPSPSFVLVLVALHGSVIAALLLLPPVFLLLLPILILSGLVSVAKYGLLLLRRSVRQVWLTEQGWFIRYHDQGEAGPFELTANSRLGQRFIRVSLKASPQGSAVRHVLLTPGMVGPEHFRRLQVFLRWAPDKQSLPAAQTTNQ
ncbi:protein YgfX [Ketobacter sp.]|uniref:protein YgfX n=1 Tax=Ketobacter sp. TaxID=2083498 RepID=UPI000F177782|nr:protein YgfX [Ketobacter sp.]RLT94457.1 MAG: hypothetical protein D9N14_16530 [Ketobacter sp.]